MYLWKISQLKKDLIAKKVSQRDVFLYILASNGLFLVAVEAQMYLPSQSHNLWDYANSAVAMIIGLGGILWAYLWNGGNAGEQFAERYFSIGWVTGVRFAVLLIPLVLLISLSWTASASELVPPDLAPSEEGFPTTWVEVVLIELWYLAFSWRVAHHVHGVARAT